MPSRHDASAGLLSSPLPGPVAKSRGRPVPPLRRESEPEQEPEWMDPQPRKRIQPIVYWKSTKRQKTARSHDPSAQLDNELSASLSSRQTSTANVKTANVKTANVKTANVKTANVKTAKAKNRRILSPFRPSPPSLFVRHRPSLEPPSTAAAKRRQAENDLKERAEEQAEEQAKEQAEQESEEQDGTSGDESSSTSDISTDDHSHQDNTAIAKTLSAYTEEAVNDAESVESKSGESSVWDKEHVAIPTKSNSNTHVSQSKDMPYRAATKTQRDVDEDNLWNYDKVLAAWAGQYVIVWSGNNPETGSLEPKKNYKDDKPMLKVKADDLVDRDRAAAAGEEEGESAREDDGRDDGTGKSYSVRGILESVTFPSRVKNKNFSVYLVDWMPGNGGRNVYNPTWEARQSISVAALEMYEAKVKQAKLDLNNKKKA